MSRIGVNVKEILEAHINVPHFRMGLLFPTAERYLRETEHVPALAEIRAALLAAEYQYLVRGILRSAFLIELVKLPKVETTKFEIRWSARLDPEDPRHASFETCQDIMRALLQSVAESIPTERRRILCQRFHRVALLPYELPIDYAERVTNGPIHTPGNVVWLWDNEEVERTLALREAVLDHDVVGQGAAEVFKLVLEHKIQVKTYLTDRVLTGAHKTNREKRWETHPLSLHWASRLDCLRIERKLIEDLCHFDGFPEDVRAMLRERGLIADGPVTHCPVTLDPLQYADLLEEIRDPEHGKSAFQVAHLNPLKAVGDAPNVGHIAGNIGWISADGNRIQGSLTLEEVRQLLGRIAANYELRGYNW